MGEYALSSAGKAPTVAIAARRKKSLLARLNPYLYMLPAVAFVLFWVYRPLLQMLQLSLYEWSMVPGTIPVYVGLKNFTMLLRSQYFLPSVGNSIFYIAGMLPFTVVLPMLLAVATQDLSPAAKRIYRGLFFVPMLMTPVSTAVIFQWLFHPTNGLINNLLLQFGLIDQGFSWFATDPFAKIIILCISGWKMVGFGTLLYSAGLTAVDTQYYEAAALDGANALHRFFYITLPLLSSTTFTMLLITVLFSGQMTFAFVDMLTHGGPYGTSTDLFYLMYTRGFQGMEVGLGEASAAILMVLFGSLALIMQALSRRFVFYDD